MSKEADQPAPFTRVVIVGVGLIGGSIALALRRLGQPPQLVGITRGNASAEELNVDVVSQSLRDTVEALDEIDALDTLVILAVPLSKTRSTLEQLVDFPGIITDAGSVKGTVLSAADDVLRAGHRFVGSHPMAGSERKGCEAARANLFDGKPCVLTPAPGRDDLVADVERVEAFWRSIGMKTMRMSVADHDHKVAVISHLPHAAACLLVELAEQLGGREVASTGFADTTRLAASNPPMRADIMLDNRAELIGALGAMSDRIQALSEMLRTGDRDALTAYLEHIREAKLHPEV